MGSLMPSFLYAFACTLFLAFIANFVDLPNLVGNWEEKSRLLMHLKLYDNYYPPGAAIFLIPFLWNEPSYHLMNLFYFFVSAFTYFKICEEIRQKVSRRIALLALPANSYLLWLILTSADQIVELTNLLLFIYFGIRRKFYLTLFWGFMLCFTRPAYWISYVVLVFALTSFEKHKSKVSILKKCAAVLVLFITLLFNQVVFSSPSLSTSSGGTFFYSHEKFHYLSLPKFDMDVLLKNGESTNAELISKNSSKFMNISDPYLRAGLISITDNPQRFIFSQILKVDSYFFSIQKIPNLPGQYELSKDEKSILIGDERLTWPLTLGHLEYAIYRIFSMILLAIIFVWFVIKFLAKKKISDIEKLLSFPYILSFIPCFLFYTETRFKICSELLLIPLGFIVLEKLKLFVKAKKECDV